MSISSAYTSAASSAYSSTRVAPVEDNQETLRAEKRSQDSSYNDEINDEAVISKEAQALLAQDKIDAKTELAAQDDKKLQDAKADEDTAAKGEEKLTPSQQQEVANLKARDAEVRTHEQAHISAASGLNASAPNYTYKTGPDGKKYAVAGEVDISFNKSDNPEENIAKAQTMKAAATAPAQPSNQDMSVARKADQLISEATQELAQKDAGAAIAAAGSDGSNQAVTSDNSSATSDLKV